MYRPGGCKQLFLLSPLYILVYRKMKLENTKNPDLLTGWFFCSPGGQETLFYLRGTSKKTCHFAVERMSVFKIKVLYCARAGCIGSKNCAPGSFSMCSSLYKGIDTLEKACTHRVNRPVLKPVYPAAKMCTQGAGCRVQT